MTKDSQKKCFESKKHKFKWKFIKGTIIKLLYTDISSKTKYRDL